MRRAPAALFPLFLLAITAFAVFGSEVDLAGCADLPAALNPVLLTLAAVLLFYPAVAICERVWPYRPEWNREQGDLRADLLYLTVSGPMITVFFGATVAGVAASAGAWLSQRFGASLWPASWPALAQLFLAIAVAELGHYAFHRLSHEHPLVWRVHATHHSAPRLYWGNATRFHPIDLFCLIVLQSGPLILLGAPPRAFLMYSLFQAVYGQLQHGNFEVRARWLDWIFSTPNLHRLHHATDARIGNHNYGAILIVWDHVFRSFHRPRDRSFDGPVGIAALPRFPRGWLAQLASPFQWASLVRESRGERVN